MRQLHSALLVEYRDAHIRANKTPPVPKLEDNPEYAAAYKLATHEALPDKGERPDRDPQVQGYHLPFAASSQWMCNRHRR